MNCLNRCDTQSRYNQVNILYMFLGILFGIMVIILIYQLKQEVIKLQEKQDKMYSVIDQWELTK